MDTRHQLRLAVISLQLRGLKNSAKWAAEQLEGLADYDEDGGGSTVAIDHIEDDVDPTVDPALPASKLLCRGPTECSDRYLLAKSFFDMGEYERAAHVLQAPGLALASSNEERAPEAGVGIRDGTPEGLAAADPALLLGLVGEELFLKAYALYLSGEKAKEQEMMQLNDALDRTKQAVNPYLKPLHRELATLYAIDDDVGEEADMFLDAFGLYIFGVVLKDLAVVGGPDELFPEVVTAQTVLAEAAESFPWNWSAWVDLAEVCIDSSAKKASDAKEKISSSFSSSPSGASNSFHGSHAFGSEGTSMTTQGETSAPPAFDPTGHRGADRLSLAIRALSPYLEGHFENLKQLDASTTSRQRQGHSSNFESSRGLNRTFNSSASRVRDDPIGSILQSSPELGPGRSSKHRGGVGSTGHSKKKRQRMKPEVPWAKRFFLAHACIELGGQRECEAALVSLMSLRIVFPKSNYLFGQVSGVLLTLI
jgi:hypothetical protein